MPSKKAPRVPCLYSASILLDTVYFVPFRPSRAITGPASSCMCILCPSQPHTSTSADRPRLEVFGRGRAYMGHDHARACARSFSRKESRMRRGFARYCAASERGLRSSFSRLCKSPLRAVHVRENKINHNRVQESSMWKRPARVRWQNPSYEGNVYGGVKCSRQMPHMCDIAAR